MPGRWGLYVAIIWTLLSAAVATRLGPWGFGAAVVGLLLAWAYSAPPFRLKQNGWWGNLACGACYEGLAWATGAAVMAGGTMPDYRSLVLAGLYSLGAHGIMTLNDFKSIEGDRQTGIGSLPVRLGVRNAARAACLMMALPQAVVVLALIAWGHPVHALGVMFLLMLQLFLMDHFTDSPSERAIWYSAIGINFFVLGMLLSAFALRAGYRDLA
jgi:chlorophyll synthase